MPFRVTPNVRVKRDRDGIARHLNHLQAPYLATDAGAPTPLALAQAYVRDVANVYGSNPERRSPRAARRLPAARRAAREVASGDPDRTRATDTEVRGANAEARARYAALCQENGPVPIVEPGVLINGDHTIERCFEVPEAVQRAVFAALYRHDVELGATLLKPSMALSGNRCAQQAGVTEVATATLRCLRRTVPAAVPGILFLSGGQPAQAATAHLNAMNSLPGPRPWTLSFSYSRALQEAPLETWKGDAARVAAAQKAFYHRAKCSARRRVSS